MLCETCKTEELEAFSSRAASRCRRCERDAQLRSKYGIDLETFERLLSRQGGKCAICATRKATVVDHCHESSRVRGLLCAGCNKGLGLFRDSVEVVARALNYLANS